MPRAALPPRPIVIVTWDDARGSSIDAVDDSNLDSVHQPYPVQTMGWLMRDDDQGVSICGECVDGTSFRGHTFIPRAMIRAMRSLTRKKRTPVDHE